MSPKNHKDNRSSLFWPVHLLSGGIRIALRVAAAYLLFSAGWILLSDRLLEQVTASRELLSSLQTMKGLVFVTLSALLIFYLVNRYIQSAIDTKVQLRTLVDTLPDLVWLKDKNGVFLLCNHKFERLFGRPEKEILGKTDYDFVAEDLADFFRKHDVNAMHAGCPTINEEQVTYGDDGHTEQLETIKTPMTDPGGRLIGILGVGRDITQRKAREQEIRVLKQALEQSPVSVMLTDLQGHIEFVNRAFEQVSGYSADEVLGQNPRFLRSERSSDELFRQMWGQLSAGRSWAGEMQNLKKNGTLYWENVSISPVVDEDDEVTHYLAVKEDITLRKQQEAKLQYQAHYDPLTGLPNRVLVLDRLQQLVQEAARNHEQVAVLFLDLDDFKKINDSLGHDVGDQALHQIAERLQSSLRKCDTIGRLGGDEFILLAGRLKDTSSVSVIAQHVLKLFELPFVLEGRTLSLTPSLGIAIYPGDGVTTSELLKNSDSAMYSAKSRGRNCFAFFEQSMNNQLARRLQLEEQLAGAISSNELRVSYQAQVDLKTKQVTGVEALLRWNNPELGEVPPDEFIPIAEQTGLILPIGRFVLEEAMQAVMGWQKPQHGTFRLAVNISPNQFRDQNLLPLMRALQKKASAENIQLELEVTEGVLMSGDVTITDMLASLHDMGTSLAMDDFGTGYSSLSYLRKYPFDLLKIDRSFIQDMTEDSSDLELVNAAISMAHGLGISVLAEGVETQQQLEALQILGCDYAQGYLFNKPVPSDQMAVLLQQQQAMAS